MKYPGWFGVKEHERARPHDPEVTKAFNAEIHAKEQAAERARAALEAKKRTPKDAAP